VSAVVQPGPIDGLTLIPAGRCDVHTIRTLDWKRLPELIRRMKDEFQIVLFDTAPLLSLPDTLYLAGHADGAVLSVRRDVSRMPAVWAAIQRLNMFKCRVVGTIVNGEPLSDYATYAASQRAAEENGGLSGVLRGGRVPASDEVSFG
jgi:Mrp family chromosome partitioning ATPase